MLNPVHLKTLLAVLRTGSFVNAGHELGYTASAVSQQMSSLEKVVGVALFERTPNGVRPLLTAHELGRRAERALAALVEVEAEGAGLRAGRLGRVRIGTFPSAGPILVPQTLKELVSRGPEVEVLLEEGEPDELVPRMVDGILDLALCYEYSVAPRPWPADTTRHPLLEEQLVLLVPAGWPQAQSLGGVPLSVYAEECWVASAAGSAGSACLERLCASQGFAPRVSFRTNNYDTISAIVAAGLGVAIVPEFGHRRSAEVAWRRLPPSLATRRIFALSRRENKNPLVALAISALRCAAELVAVD